MGSTGVNIAQSSNNNSALANGTAGTYQLYRAGTIDVKNGFIFLSPDKDISNLYAHSTGEDREVNQYSVQISNPLVVNGEFDTVALRNAWLALHPDKTPQDYVKKLGSKGLTEKKWQQLDKENAAALKNSKYDAVIYKNGDKVKEVWIHSSRKNDFDKVK